MNPFSAAQTSLAMSDMANNIPGMTSDVQPGPNYYDTGLASKLVNSQPSMNNLLAEQLVGQNITTALPQAAAEAMGQVRSQAAAESNATQKAIDLREQYKAETLWANDSGTALMTINSQMQSPEKAKLFREGLAIGKATGSINPDLLDAQGQANQYMV